MENPISDSDEIKNTAPHAIKSESMTLFQT